MYCLLGGLKIVPTTFFQRTRIIHWNHWIKIQIPCFLKNDGFRIYSKLPCIVSCRKAVANGFGSDLELPLRFWSISLVSLWGNFTAALFWCLKWLPSMIEGLLITSTFREVFHCHIRLIEIRSRISQVRSSMSNKTLLPCLRTEASTPKLIWIHII